MGMPSAYSWYSLREARVSSRNCSSMKFGMAALYSTGRSFRSPAGCLNGYYSEQETAMHTVMVARGVHWVTIPEAGLSILCGCPADSVKLLMKKGLIVGTQKDGVAFE